MEASHLKRLKELEAENSKLKKMYAEQAIQLVMEKKETKSKESLRHDLNDIIKTTNIEKLKKVLDSMAFENVEFCGIAVKQQD
jgi:ABC-type lipopolysaccharide export system ATPase subunit